jgi:hypothetical protein
MNMLQEPIPFADALDHVTGLLGDRERAKDSLNYGRSDQSCRRFFRASRPVDRDELWGAKLRDTSPILDVCRDHGQGTKYGPSAP